MNLGQSKRCTGPESTADKIDKYELKLFIFRKCLKLFFKKTYLTYELRN